MNQNVTKVMGRLQERWRTRPLHSDIFHPKRHWYTLLGVAFGVACVGGLVGFLEYRSTQKVFLVESAGMETSTQTTEDELSAVLQAYHTRATSFSAVRETRGMVAYPSEILQFSEDVSAVERDEVVEEIVEPSVEDSVMISP